MIFHLRKEVSTGGTEPQRVLQRTISQYLFRVLLMTDRFLPPVSTAPVLFVIIEGQLALQDIHRNKINYQYLEAFLQDEKLFQLRTVRSLWRRCTKKNCS